MNDSPVKRRITRFLLLLLFIGFVIVISYNPVKCNETVVEVTLYDNDMKASDIHLSQDQSAIVIRTLKKCWSIRKLVLTKTEYASPGVYHIMTDNARYFIGKENNKPIIHCTRFTGNWLADGEWTLKYQDDSRYLRAS